MQVVDEVTRIDLVDGDHLEGFVVEVGEPFFPLNSGPVLFHRRYIVE